MNAKKHRALQLALIPIVTLMAGLLPGLIAGSVIVEYIFSIPGIGQLTVTALYSRDYPMMMFSVALGTVLMLVGILISDLCYALVDPRITYE
jgi:peptide/nickel transport system permease protein